MKPSAQKDILFGNSLALQVTGLTPDGESSGGPTLGQLVVGGIVGSPEGRALGNPGDIRVRKDVPQLWQKISGLRNRIGWSLISGGGGSSSCPSNRINVGPECEFTEIQAAVDFAQSQSPAVDNIFVIEIAPGVYVENVLLPPLIVLQGIGYGIQITGAVTPVVTGGPLLLYVLQNIRLGAGTALIVPAAAAAQDVIANGVAFEGQIAFSNTTAGSRLSLYDVEIVTPGTPITFSGGMLELSRSVLKQSGGTGINIVSGEAEIEFTHVEGRVQIAAGSQATITQSTILSETEAIVVDGVALVTSTTLGSANDEDDAVTGTGEFTFASLGFSGSAKTLSATVVIDEGTAYATTVPGTWAVPAPDTVGDAIDRIASAVAGILVAPIP